MNLGRTSGEALGLSNEQSRMASAYLTDSVRRASNPENLIDPALVEHRRKLFAALITSALHTRNGVEAGRASGLFASLVQGDALRQAADLLEHQGRAVLFTDLKSYRIRGTRGRSPMTAGHLLPLDEIVDLFREFHLMSEHQSSEESFTLACVRARLPEVDSGNARRLSEMVRSYAQMVIATYRERRSQADASQALLGTEDRAELAERAAIQEFDGGLRREEAERAAFTSHLRRPH